MASRILFKQKAAFLFRLIALDETLDVATLEISKSQRAGNRAGDEQRSAHKGNLEAGDIDYGAPIKIPSIRPQHSLPWKCAHTQ